MADEKTPAEPKGRSEPPSRARPGPRPGTGRPPEDEERDSPVPYAKHFGDWVADETEPHAEPPRKRARSDEDVPERDTEQHD